MAVQEQGLRERSLGAKDGEGQQEGRTQGVTGPFRQKCVIMCMSVATESVHYATHCDVSFQLVMRPDLPWSGRTDTSW